MVDISKVQTSPRKPACAAKSLMWGGRGRPPMHTCSNVPVLKVLGPTNPSLEKTPCWTALRQDTYATMPAVGDPSHTRNYLNMDQRGTALLRRSVSLSYTMATLLVKLQKAIILPVSNQPHGHRLSSGPLKTWLNTGVPLGNQSGVLGIGKIFVKWGQITHF